jgi:4-amino-4-deoxy-L-arabinose transferase-like glycosyltransferase
MEVDSAQYYSMAVEMLNKGEFLEFTDRGKPYLDKPPFIFWVSGLFFSIFGISEFAFKLPSILFSILGIYSCYRFARLYYSNETALLAALILATTQGYYHFNNDVRTDTYLTNSVIASVWLIAEFLSHRKLLYCLGGFFFAGIAMLSKGPMGLVSPILAYFVQGQLARIVALGVACRNLYDCFGDKSDVNWFIPPIRSASRADGKW